MRNRTMGDGNPFPKIARGHRSWHDNTGKIHAEAGRPCGATGCSLTEAHYSTGKPRLVGGKLVKGEETYVDGHFQGYATALRAYQEGIR